MDGASSIESALAAAEPLLDVEGVHGIGQGESDGSPCVLVMVAGLREEDRARIPADVEGFPIVLRDLGGPPTAEEGIDTGVDAEIEPDCA
jgi:hypothetical protein